MANRPDLCVMRPEIFETDPWGYRNTSDVWSRRNEILLFGDSFALGQGVSQEEIPAVQLSKFSRKNVYDGAGKLELEYLHWLISHFKTKPKTVVFFHLEIHNHRPEEVSDLDKTLNTGDLLQKADIFWKSFWAYNPLKIIFSRFEKRFFTPGLFPNRYGEKVPLFNLRNGRPFLFLDSSVQRFGDPRTNDVAQETEYFDDLHGVLDQKGIKLLVVLVPEKYSVYAPLVNKAPGMPLKNPSYLMSLQGELIRRRIPTVNLLPTLLREAAEQYKSGRYIYWPDDTHWNADGIRRACELISKSL
jgi:hypothetical protein